jgi:hypothetical protein
MGVYLEEEDDDDFFTAKSLGDMVRINLAALIGVE